MLKACLAIDGKLFENEEDCILYQKQLLENTVIFVQYGLEKQQRAKVFISVVDNKVIFNDFVNAPLIEIESKIESIDWAGASNKYRNEALVRIEPINVYEKIRIIYCKYDEVAISKVTELLKSFAKETGKTLEIEFDETKYKNK